MTDSNAVPGTPEYLCPETLREPKKKASETSDIYQCGVLLYHLLCGRAPFQGTVTSILQQIVNSDPVGPRKLRRGISRDLERILDLASTQKLGSSPIPAEKSTEAMTAWRAASAAIPPNSIPASTEFVEASKLLIQVLRAQGRQVEIETIESTIGLASPNSKQDEQG